MKANARILMVEDDPSAASALGQVLSNEGYDLLQASAGDQGLLLGQDESVELLLTDLRLPKLDGLQLITQLHQLRPRLPIILMTAHGTTETAIEATKLGAYDYLVKPFEMEEMLDLVSKALQSSRLASEPIDMNETGTGRAAIVGNSRQMQNIYKEIGRIAAKPVTVLLLGETGTGKEMIARAIYQHSDRAIAPFIAINCAAIPETLLESELFGHEKGAFTGADHRRIGRFEQAQGGTLFLDEIGDMSLSTQAKLLRVLQERTIQRLGGRESIPVDIRVIAATHRDLESAIKGKQFREDLYYRLNVVTLHLPPLRQRADDIPALVKYFMQRSAHELGIEAPSIQPQAVEFLRTQPWPGNVRQLENVVRRALLTARKYAISLEDIKSALSGGHSTSLPRIESLESWIGECLRKAQENEMEEVHGVVLEEVERQLFSQAIKLAQGNQAKAARWLGISRLTMREKLLHFNLHPATEGLSARAE